MHFIAISFFLFRSRLRVIWPVRIKDSVKEIETTSQESRMAGPSDFDFESFKKELLEEIRDEARQIVRDMMAELREERQAVAPIAPIAPPAPQYRPFDLDAETLGKQPIEGNQEILIAEPITRQRLDISKEIEKSD